MDLVLDADGHAAPRLNDVELSEELALAYHALLLNQVVRMLCAGVIHGDLSEYNILVGADGPVIIDLPQAIDAAGGTVTVLLVGLELGAYGLIRFAIPLAPIAARDLHGLCWPASAPRRSSPARWRHWRRAILTLAIGVYPLPPPELLRPGAKAWVAGVGGTVGGGMPDRRA